MMKRAFIAFALLFAVGTAMAAEGGWKTWYVNMLRGLKAKVDARMASKTRVSAVAAVRGANQNEDPYALYWKGGISEKAQKKLDDERKQLTSAVELVVNGDLDAGRDALSKFIKDNPDSYLVKDAQEALKNLPQPGAAGAQRAPAAAEETAEKPAAGAAPAPAAQQEGKPSGKQAGTPAPQPEGKPASGQALDTVK